VKQVGRELGVRYVLEGSVRTSATASYHATAHRCYRLSHIWADRFDGAIEDIFDLQDQVTATVVGAIAPKWNKAEIERARRKPTANLDAYDYYLQGIAQVYQATSHANDDALRLFYKAVELDPNLRQHMGMAACCYAWRKMSGWMTTQQRKSRKLLGWLGTQCSWAGRMRSRSAWWVRARIRGGEVEDGAAFIDQRFILNPNLAAGWLLSGWVNIYLGEHEVTIECAKARHPPQPTRSVHISYCVYRNWRRSFLRRPL